MALLFVATACSPRWSPEPLDWMSVPPSSHTDRHTMANEELENWAYSARMAGDAQGAIDAYLTLIQRGWSNPRVPYQLGVALEEAEEYARAASIYDAILNSNPDPILLRDSTFRLALCLWEIQENRAARDALERLPDHHAYTLEDRYSYDLALGTAWLRTGRPKRGTQRIIEALIGAEDSPKVHWMRSLALHALMEECLRKASHLHFQVREKKQASRLTRRIELLRESEEYLRRIMRLEEPHWMMIAWLNLGDAYTRFAEDLMQAPPPRTLSENQATLYRQQAKKQAIPLQRKALQAYEWGMEVAIRTARQDHRSARLLRERLSELEP